MHTSQPLIQDSDAFTTPPQFKAPVFPSHKRSMHSLDPSDQAQIYNLHSQEALSPTLIYTPAHRRHNTELKVLSPRDINIVSSIAVSSQSCRTSSCLTQPRIRPLSRTSSFATLAPLPSTKTSTRTPIDHERTLKRSADSITRLLISDDTENTNSSDSESQTRLSSHPKRRKDIRFQRRASRRQKFLLRSPTHPQHLSPIPLPSSPCPTYSQSLSREPSIISLGSPLSHPRFFRVRRGSHSSTSSTGSAYRSDRDTQTLPTNLPTKHLMRNSNGSDLSDSEDEETLKHSMVPFASDTRYRVTEATPHIRVENDGFITPSLTPSPSSAWPTHTATVEVGPQKEDVEQFILNTLSSSTAGSTASIQEKKMPHTPVKRQPFLSQNARRPWTSVGRINTSVGMINAGDGGLFGKARKSMPNTLPSFSTFATPFRRPPMKNLRDAFVNPDFSPTTSQTPTTPIYEPKMLQRFDSGSSFGSDGSSYGTPTRPRGSFLTPSYRLANKSNLVNSPAHLLSFSRGGKMGRLEKEFEVISELGIGEFGNVMKVRARREFVVAPYSFGLEFALKRTRRFEGQRRRARLLEEATILKKLCSGTAHRNVVAYVDSWEEDNMLFILTELYPLGNFAHFLSEYGARFERLEQVRCWKILADLSSGLGFVHGAGVIHLDIKPENIFLALDGRFVIGDFGLATEWPRNDVGFEREGDKQYLAAEVLQGMYGKEADIFSLGMTMLEAAANIIVPDMGEPWHSLRQDDFSAIEMPQESWQMFRLIQEMMRSEPKKRPTIEWISECGPVRRAREWMASRRAEMMEQGAMGAALFATSPLAGEEGGVLALFLDRGSDGDERRGEMNMD